MFRSLCLASCLFLGSFSYATSGVPVYRSLNDEGDYLFSVVAKEGPVAGYFPQEARFAVEAVASPDTRPLYRCWIKNFVGGHFLSMDSKCEGQAVEGVLGHVSIVPKPGLVPLTRFVDLKTNHHISALPSEEAFFFGWKREGVQAYVQPLALPTVVQTKDDGKKYFSYFAGAMDGVGVKNYIPELSKVSNLIFIKSEKFEEKLIQCEQLGVKAVITFDWVFFDANYKLRDDYEARFLKIEPIIRKHLGVIAAFYGVDEPYNNGLFKKLKVSEIYYSQETMGRFLKSRFPQMPIGVILTTSELKDSRPLFPSFDWFGFDCYDADMSCGGRSVDWYYAHLNNMLNAMTKQDGKTRYVIAVPQAGHPNRDGVVYGEKSILKQIPQYREIVRRSPNIKVVMPFIWQTFDDGVSQWRGAREIPEVVRQYTEFYKEFVKR